MHNHPTSSMESDELRRGGFDCIAALEDVDSESELMLVRDNISMVLKLNVAVSPYNTGAKLGLPRWRQPRIESGIEPVCRRR